MEASYYNEKYRLSDEIDRLKDIIRGMQIDKIKASPTSYIPTPPPNSQRIQLQEGEDHY